MDPKNATSWPATRSAPPRDVSAEALSVRFNDEPLASEIPPPGRILLIDDDDAVRNAYRRALDAAGLVVDDTADPAIALQLLNERHYDAVLTDVRMPKLNGFDLMRAVRASDLVVPILMMTAHPSVRDAADSVESGALQYLLKPIETSVLQSAVVRAVQLNRMALAELHAAEVSGVAPVRPTDRIGLEASLDSALASLWVAFHPVLEAGTGSIYGYEALLRCGEPALPTPQAVLQAAERLNRLPEVSSTIRRRAARPFTRRPEAGVLFVNVHLKDLLDPDLLDPAAPLSAIARRVVLEFPECSAVHATPELKERVQALRALGFRMAIDDLGAGYSGLSSFTVFEPDLIKLDISLVRGVHQSRTKQRIIRSMIELAREMRISTVAEGIELRAERDCLTQLGCNLLQGFLFAHPGPAFPKPNW